MKLIARSSAAVLLGLSFFLGAPTEAQAQAKDCITKNGNKCGGTLPGCNPSGQQPQKCFGEDGVGGTDDDLVDPSQVQAAGFTRPSRADTGFGGSSSSGSETTILLVGGGLLALGAAVGVRRASRGGKA